MSNARLLPNPIPHQDRLSRVFCTDPFLRIVSTDRFSNNRSIDKKSFRYLFKDTLCRLFIFSQRLFLPIRFLTCIVSGDPFVDFFQRPFATDPIPYHTDHIYGPFSKGRFPTIRSRTETVSTDSVVSTSSQGSFLPIFLRRSLLLMRSPASSIFSLVCLCTDLFPTIVLLIVFQRAGIFPTVVFYSYDPSSESFLPFSLHRSLFTGCVYLFFF